MYDRILFPADGSEGANEVFDYALALAEAQDATLYLLHVADTTRDSVTRIGGEVVDVLEREGEQIVAELAERATARHVSTVTDVIQGAVPETITTYAEELSIDLIVMPTRGRTGLQQLLLGSSTDRVIRQTTTPVLTLRPDDTAVRYPYQNVLVPTDGSDCATAALEHAIDLVTATQATLHLLSVVDVTSPGADVYSEHQVDAIEERAKQIVAESAGLAEAESVESVVEALEFDSAISRGILSYIDDHEIDLVVVGTHGRTGVERYLLGSVTEKLIRTAPVPVLTIPESMPETENRSPHRSDG
ncbi:universal stress protein [Salinilacihabitans rarus]|uniref:universal stress protein n=1 Tax=Salinilacihabitans rarus TaxID=2961596 RepID=UPI0020C8E2C7|nr:universal stress protein [Salinilacihabitans rarus]